MFDIDNVCLWNRAVTGSGANTQLNGEYEYLGNYSGHPYYYVSHVGCGISELYMYYHSSINKWLIGRQLGSNTYFAYCDTENINYPTDCGSNWIFPSETDDSLDTDVEVSIAPCPSLSCTEISLHYISNNPDPSQCEGFYDTFVDDYIYSKIINNNEIRYLYFNYKSFKWVCSNNDTFSACYSAYGVQTTPKWYDLNQGESAYFNWSTNNEIANLTCFVDRTPAPTPVTNPPTTSMPTMQATTDDLCMWYRGPDATTNTNINLNGKYRYNGTLNGKNYYVMTSGLL